MMIINLLGLMLIAIIIWWFWLYKAKEVTISEDRSIIVVENGIYQPSRIKLLAGQHTKIHFFRKDASPCSATVLIPDLEITKELAINKKTSINLPPLDKGEYPFHCQMQMYKGTLVVE